MLWFRLIHNEDVLPGDDTDANYAECKTIKTINTVFVSQHCQQSSLFSKGSSPVLFVFTIFICPANLSLVAKCHPGPGSWREWSVRARRLRSDGESTETITLYSPQCFPCHGWSRTLADLVKGFICYSEEQILQKQTRKRTVYLTFSVI